MLGRRKKLGDFLKQEGGYLPIDLSRHIQALTSFQNNEVRPSYQSSWEMIELRKSIYVRSMYDVYNQNLSQLKTMNVILCSI